MRSMRSISAIREQIARTIPSLESGRTAYSGLTYEEGVDYALRWVIGDASDEPMEDDRDEG